MCSCMCALWLLAIATLLLMQPAARAQDLCPHSHTDEDISAFLKPYLDSFVASNGKPGVAAVSKPPAVAAAVARYDPNIGGDAIIAAYGAAGVRKVDDPFGIPFLRSDRIKIGSCSKSFASAAVAMLVQQGLLKWTDTLSQVFSGSGWSIWGTYGQATVAQLMGHRAGFIRDFPFSALPPLVPLKDQRTLFAQLLLNSPPAFATGQFSYSNAGYILVAHIIERKTGTAYESFVQQNIFAPLGIQGNWAWHGMGATQPPTQPWGHDQLNNMSVSLTPDGGASQIEYGNSAGGVNLPVADHAKWAGFHLQATMGGGPKTCSPWAPPCIDPANMARLHTNLPATPADQGGNYAMAWANFSGPSWFGSNSALWHNGGVVGWYSLQYVLPDLGLAITVVENNGGTPGSFIDKVAQDLAAKFTVPACSAAPAVDPALQVSRPGGCVATSSGFKSDSKCSAGALGTEATHSVSTWKDCAKACLADATCQAWTVAPSALLSGAATCTTISSAIVRSGRKLKGFSPVSITLLYVYTCGPADGWISGTADAAVGDTLLFNGQGRVNAGLPFNVVNGAGSCAASVLQCQKHCIAARFSPYGPCRSWMYNASLKQCFLYKETGNAAAVDRVPMCDLTTGTVTTSGC